MVPRRFRVLVIDDQRDNLVSVRALLDESFPDCETRTTLSGEDGLEQAFECNPDVVLLDILMPGMDGFEICRRLKADPRTSDTPVVFVTAIKDDSASRIRALEAGGEAFLTKPIEPTELKVLIRTMLKIRTATLEKKNEEERLLSMVEERTRELVASRDAAHVLLEVHRREIQVRKALEEDLLDAQRLSSIANFHFDAATGEIRWSDEIRNIVGTNDPTTIGRNAEFEPLIHPDDLPEVRARIRTPSSSTEGPGIAFRLVRPDGAIRHVDLHFATLYGENGEATDTRGTLQDITGLKEKDIQLARSERLYRTFIDASQDFIFLKNEKFEHLFVNARLAEYYGLPASDVPGRTDFEIMSENAARICRLSDEKMLALGAPVLSEEAVRGRFFETYKFPVPMLNGKTGIGGILRDISERKKSETRLYFLSFHDHLTGLYNRRFLEEQMERLEQEGNAPCSIIIADINGVKFINDAFGHAAGDKAIVATAKCLRTCCRQQDILARTGGDEFLLLLPSTNADSARRIMSRIRHQSEQTCLDILGKGIGLSIATGIATRTQPQQPLSAAIKEAEDDMYQAKLLDRKSTHNSLLASIRATLTEKSQETGSHSDRLIDLSLRIGRILGLSDKELQQLELLSVLHDIGKVGIPDKILSKPGKLTEREWAILKKHPVIGHRIAMASPELAPIADLILYHHERWDGMGYPQGLSGERIPLLARILAVVDSFDAMAEDRPYRKRLTREAIVEEFRFNEGKQFDPKIARIFLHEILDDGTSFSPDPGPVRRDPVPGEST